MYLAYKHVKAKRQKAREAVPAVHDHDPVHDPLQLDPLHHPPHDPPAPPAPDKAAKRARLWYRLRVIFGLMMPFTLQGLDTTIVAAALPYIAADFDQIAQLNWIVSAFNLTAAAFLPFWSQIADVFGRHAALQAALVVVLVGSALCTAAPARAFAVLLLGRALQGVGASGLNMCVRTVLADRVSLREYALQWTLFTLISGFSFSIGPVVGGYLTETSWRWCFAINLPVGVVAVALVALLLRKDLLGPLPLPGDAQRSPGRRLRARLATLDAGGQLLFLAGLGLLILALTWAGGAHGWASAHVLAPLVVGAVLAAAWLAYEALLAPGRALARRLPAQRPMLPWALLRQRDMGLLFCINASLGTALFANLYFLDLFFALVQGKSASQAGVALLYFLPGLGLGAYVAMFACNVWPRQTLPPLLLGAVATAVGASVLPAAVRAARSPLAYGMMALSGFGVGARMNPAALHGLAYFPRETAAVSCVVALALPLGGTASLTLMTTVFNNKGGAADPRHAIAWGLVAVLPFLWLTVALTTLLGNVWLRKGDDAHETVSSPYLWSLLLRRPLVRERRARGEQTDGR